MDSARLNDFCGKSIRCLGNKFWCCEEAENEKESEIMIGVSQISSINLNQKPRHKRSLSGATTNKQKSSLVTNKNFSFQKKPQQLLPTFNKVQAFKPALQSDFDVSSFSSKIKNSIRSKSKNKFSLKNVRNNYYRRDVLSRQSALDIQKLINLINDRDN